MAGFQPPTGIAQPSSSESRARSRSRRISILAPLLAVLVAPAAWAVSPGYVGGWGGNSYGQLGNGYKTQYGNPPLEWADVTSGLHRAIAVDAGEANTIAVAKDGSVWVWGSGAGAGNGTSGDVLVPTRKTDLSGTFIAVRAGGEPLNTNEWKSAGFSLALRSDGTVWSWGSGNLGQLGDGLLHGVETAARQVVGLSNVTDIDAGSTHSLAVSGGRVFAWGWSYGGLLGDGILSSHAAPTPVQVPGLTDVVSVSAGHHSSNQSLAIKSDGTLWGWGWGPSLGLITESYVLAPAQIPIPCTVTAASANVLISVALCSNGTVWAWPGFLEWASPKQVAELSGVTQVATRYTSAIALDSNGDVWGFEYGMTPQRVVDGSNISQLSQPRISALASGGWHSAVLVDPNPTMISQPVTLEGSILRHFGPLDLLGPHPLIDVFVTAPFSALLFGIDSPDPLVSDGTVYPPGFPCPSSCGVQLSLPPAPGSVPGPVSGTLTVRFADGSQQELAVQGQVRSNAVTVCYDEIDNDGDGYTDLEDPACSSGNPSFPDGTRASEASRCQNGLNDDNDPSGLIDFDGGQSIYGFCQNGTCPPGVSDPNHDGIADPDPQCASKSWGNTESASSCGLGFELLAVFPLLRAMQRRRSVAAWGRTRWPR